MARWWGVVLATRSVHSASVSPPSHVARLSSHNFHKRGATAAYVVGVPLAAIMQHGRWGPNVVLTYVKESIWVRMEVVQFM